MLEECEVRLHRIPKNYSVAEKMIQPDWEPVEVWEVQIDGAPPFINILITIAN